ncbi:hypothetical protein Dimus_000006 [Dionaea muscipula]
MATLFSPTVPVSVAVSSGRSHSKACQLSALNHCLFERRTPNSLHWYSNPLPASRRSAIYANYSDGDRGGGDFIAGVLLGGAVFGTLAFVFAPQIRRTLLDENEHGFRRARRPIYYDEGDDGLEKTRQTLNAKLSQLNAAIDNVSSRLIRGINLPHMPVEIKKKTDPEVEATM